MQRPVRALFVNSGIFGQKTFARFVQNAFADSPGAFQSTQIVLADGLTSRDRLVRRLLCQKLWRNGWFGLNNLDLLRRLIGSAECRREMGIRAREFVVRTADAAAYRDNLGAAIQGLAKRR